MNEEDSPPAFALPVSSFTGPVAELIAQGMLSPPTRPGLLATLDQFEILRLLGGGGMGIVLLARDSAGGRELAVKMVKSELVTNQGMVYRFLKEAGHLKRLRHPNVVAVEVISERPEGPYFVMPYFEKGSLANRIKPGQPLDVESTLDIATQVADGLSFAHRNGIIHRDLKPANILLTAGGGACLADFGLARTLFNDTITEVGSRSLEGTAPYMSPAVAAGDAEDTRCDIYSFGALLYEMLTGNSPYQARSTKEILAQIIAGPPRPVTTVNPAADRRLVAVAEGCMARELRDRYADMRDVLSDLQRIRENKEPAALRGLPGGTYHQLRAHPVLVSLGTIVCLAALACAGWLLWRPKPVVALPPVSTNAAPTHVAEVVPPVVIPPPPVVPPPVVPKPVVASPPVWKTTLLAGTMGGGGFTDGWGGRARFQLPGGVAVDRADNVYVADTANHAIRRISPDGSVDTLVGPGAAGAGDGAGASARFSAPFGVAVDETGNIFVADTVNNTIRVISPWGTVSPLAGLAGQGGSADGAGEHARFRNPWGLAVDDAGNVLVADMSNNTIRKITPAGVVSTLAGKAGVAGYADGSGTNAWFDAPYGVATDAAGNAYVADSANDCIREITPDGTVATLAGRPGYAGRADGNGANARFSSPQGLSVDDQGNIYVADTGNNAIRKITPDGDVTTLTGVAGASGTNGAAGMVVRFNSPGGVAVDGAGNIFVADTGNQIIRKMTMVVPAPP
jgi:sugar lactone lactonase YvrE